MVVPAVDVVFITELESCNTETSKKQLLNTLVSAMVNEFKLSSIEHHRFAVVTYGGSEEFEKPRSITSNGNVFTSAQNINNYFNHIRNGTGTGDVFTAITIASKLIFKPGAVKVFVLSLCTKCDFNLLKVGFSPVILVVFLKFLFGSLTSNPYLSCYVKTTSSSTSCQTVLSMLRKLLAWIALKLSSEKTSLS